MQKFISVSILSKTKKLLIILFWFLCYPLVSYTQPGPQPFFHHFIFLDEKGDTIKLYKKDVKIHKNAQDEYYDDDLKTYLSIKNNAIIINYSSHGHQYISFSIFHKGKTMTLETNMASMSIPFMEGEFKFPSEHKAILTPHLNISNLNWEIFRKDETKDSVAIQSLALEYIFDEKQRISIRKMYKISPQKLVAVSHNHFLLSNDNGKTWNMQALSTPDFHIAFYHIYQFVIENIHTYYILLQHRDSNRNTVLKTINGGKTWYVDDLLTSLNLQYLSFENKTKDIAVSREKEEYSINHESIKREVYHIFYKNKNSLQWQISENPFYLVQFHYFNIDKKHRIFLANYPYPKTDNLMYISSDYGKSWKKSILTDTCELNIDKQVFTNSAGGLQNKFLWAVQENSSNHFCYPKAKYGLYTFKNEKENKSIHIMLGKMYLYLSRDAGKTWKYIPFHSSRRNWVNIYPQDLIFLNQDEIIIVDDYHHSFKTSIKDF